MRLEKNEKLISSIGEADLVLIGIGEEWGVSFDEMLKEEMFFENYEKLTDEREKEALVPFLQREYLKEFHDETRKRAYENLLQLVSDKNYFVVSVNKDRYPELAGFAKERCVYPCGGYGIMQCDEGCSEELLESNPIADAIYQKICVGKLEQIQIPICRHCSKQMVFNNIEAGKYVEAGYLTEWNRYMKWLQGTVNKKLCLLELGVSMRFPSVIRWPFEKTVFFNQKSHMFRIHHSLSQSAENIQDRCFSKTENSVYYMANLFVS